MQLVSHGKLVGTLKTRDSSMKNKRVRTGDAWLRQVFWRLTASAAYHSATRWPLSSRFADRGDARPAAPGTRAAGAKHANRVQSFGPPGAKQRRAAPHGATLRRENPQLFRLRF